MSLATFVARDPYRPRATNEELEDLFLKMDGVVDWTIHHQGEVTVEYNRTRISDGLIEDALTGIGFRLRHVCDEPYASEAQVDEALEH